MALSAGPWSLYALHQECVSSNIQRMRACSQPPGGTQESFLLRGSNIAVCVVPGGGNHPRAPALRPGRGSKLQLFLTVSAPITTDVTRYI
jgi:hypothetical protein